MRIYKVLIVDDSAFMRKSISMIIESDDAFEIVGVARNGQEALEKIAELKPDVVTMDVEMPIMDGLTCVKEIMTHVPTPIMMLSSHTKEGDAVTIEALQNGAVDFFYKNELLDNEELEGEFLRKLKIVSTTFVYKKTSESKPSQPLSKVKKNINLVIIGSSTGGPSALTKIITELPKDFPVPIVIVQHMPDGFTKPLAERFDVICELPVKEVERGDELKNGHVYIAPAGYQTTIQKRSGTYYLNVSKDYSAERLYKPSVDVTVLSAVEYFKEDLLVTILTGMGEDGKEGCKEVKKNNGYIIAETEETAVVYGMPKSVIDAGYADEQSPIYQMYDRIKRIVF